MIRTYHGTTYTVLDLGRFRSGYLGNSSLTRVAPHDMEPERPQRTGFRLPPDVIANVERAIKAGKSHRQTAQLCGVSIKTVWRITARERKVRKDAGKATGRKPKNATPEAVIDQWQAWRNDGWTLRRIADHSGVWVQTVSRLLLERVERGDARGAQEAA